MKYDRFKIPTERGRYYKSIWLELYDGGSDQWLWVCRDGLAYIFLEVQDWVAAVGKDAEFWFGATVSVVDLLTISPKTVAGALQSCGCHDDLDFKVELDRLRIAEMCHSVGVKAPLWDEYGGLVKDRFANPGEGHPAFRRLRSDARKFAEQELFDDEKRNHLLDTKVFNALGETVREHMNGTDGMWNALRRIKDAGESAPPEQQLILKMYRAAGTTLGAGPVPEDIMGGDK
jgi:hypothetical protein